MSKKKIWLKWDQNHIIWDNNPFIWSEVYILIDILAAFGSGARGLVLDPSDTWSSVDKELKEKGFSEEQRKRFLSIVIRVNGLDREVSRSLDEVKKSIQVDHVQKTLSHLVPSIRVTAKPTKKQ